MTLAQFNGFSKAVAREDKRRLADTAAANRIGMAEAGDYKKAMESLADD